MTRHLQAALHAAENRAPRAVVEYEIDPTQAQPIVLFLSSLSTMTEARLSVEEAELLASALTSAIEHVISPATPDSSPKQ